MTINLVGLEQPMIIVELNALSQTWAPEPNMSMTNLMSNHARFGVSLLIVAAPKV
jgi:hypothetical protein